MSLAGPTTADAPLTAAEALVLLDPDKDQGKEALKLTLTELMAHRALTYHREEWTLFFVLRAASHYLRCAPDAEQRAPGHEHVQIVLRTLRAADTGGGVPMKSAVAELRRAIGTRLSDYQTYHVLPSLMRRGLLQEYQATVLWIFPVTRHRHTPAGEAARHRLLEQLAEARTLPALLNGDPARAAALAGALGSVLLLAEGLRPHYGQLSQALHGPAPDGSGGSGIDFGFDLGSFDAMDGGLDGFDGGFDGADGGGGGDGGGDGGGGGD